MIFFWMACGFNPSEPITEQDSVSAVVTISAGTYQIGSSKELNVPHTLQRTVTLTYDFVIQSTEVTYKQWLAVTPNLPNQYCESGIQSHRMSPTNPVRCVSWCDVIVFSNQKSISDGYDPAYIINEAFISNIDTIYCNEQAQFVRLNQDSNGWRLPTEAEWEIAAAIDLEENDERAWYKGNSNGHPHPVAQFEPNKWGLYDTRGNVFEWIWERFGDYELRTVTDPFHFEVPLIEVYTRPIKGGSYLSPKTALAPYNRPNASPSMMHPAIGFRLVRTNVSNDN